jgi:gamma-glutamyltranspeptidase/glutathione hydrolase
MTAATVEWPSLYSIPGSTPSHLGGRAVVGGRGMVVTPQPLAAEAGIAALRAGGNAVDAAIAASAALMVTAPMQCGPGGDAVWLEQPADGRTVAVNATGRSGTSLDPERARAAEARDGDRGGWTVTVPGAVAGWVDVLERFGTIPLGELLQPAIELAERGFFVSRYLHAAICVAEPVLRRSAEGQAWFLPDGAAPSVHSRLRQPELARCLRLLADTGGRALYDGEIATGIAAALADTDGFLDEGDLAVHATRWEEPLSLELDGLTLLQAPPNSQGVVALEALALTAARLGKPYPDLGRVDDLHVLVEALRAALADRDAVVADPDVSGVAAAGLLETGYVAARAGELDPARAGPAWAAGVGRAASSAASRDGDTANLVAIDESGLAVSLTQSLFYDFGSGVPVTGFGFMLQNRGACFSFDGEARNAIAPGRRPLHTLMPGMAVAAGRVRHVFGCMGGHGQAQTQAQLLARVAAGDDPQEAIGAPRFFVDPTATEPTVSIESRMPAALRDGLAAKGFAVESLGEWEELMGHAQFISIESAGAFVGGCDPRTDGHVAAW